MHRHVVALRNDRRQRRGPCLEPQERHVHAALRAAHVAIHEQGRDAPLADRGRCGLGPALTEDRLQAVPVLTQACQRFVDRRMGCGFGEERYRWNVREGHTRAEQQLPVADMPGDEHAASLAKPVKARVVAQVLRQVDPLAIALGREWLDVQEQQRCTRSSTRRLTGNATPLVVVELVAEDGTQVLPRGPTPARGREPQHGAKGIAERRDPPRRQRRHDAGGREQPADRQPMRDPRVAQAMQERAGGRTGRRHPGMLRLMPPTAGALHTHALELACCTPQVLDTEIPPAWPCGRDASRKSPAAGDAGRAVRRAARRRDRRPP